MKKRIIALLLAALLLFAAAPAGLAAGYTPEEQYRMLQQLEELILTEGLESSPEDDPFGRALLAALEAYPELYEFLMAGMLSGYDDYTGYIPAGTYDDAYGGTADYVGVGVTIVAHPQGVRVTQLALDGPALEAGLRIGDVICGADGLSLEGKSSDQIASLLRGEEGTSVRLEVLRGEEKLTFTVTRRLLQTLNYSGGHLEEGIYYMKWDRIGDKLSYYRFKMGLRELQHLGDSCLILDLRDNPGGSLSMAFDITSSLIDEAIPFFETAYRDPDTADELIVEPVVADGVGVTVPHVFVLTNENSASAAEIIAAGLRDTGRAVTVGAATYGKARAQQHLMLRDDAAVVLTVMQLRSLRDGDYQGVGLAPDVPVENEVYKGENAIRVPEDVPLAPGSCSDNAQALNRALVALGLLETLPEKPYQVSEKTLEACRRLELLRLEQQPEGEGVSTRTLQLINYLLDLQGQGMYVRDTQLDTALQLARQALAEENAQ